MSFTYLEDRGPVWESFRAYTYTERAERALSSFLELERKRNPGMVGWAHRPVDANLSLEFRFWQIRAWEEIFPEVRAGVVMLEGNPRLQRGGKEIEVVRYWIPSGSAFETLEF